MTLERIHFNSTYGYITFNVNRRESYDFDEIIEVIRK